MPHVPAVAGLRRGHRTVPKTVRGERKGHGGLFSHSCRFLGRPRGRIILDTDHISVLQHEDSSNALALLQKLDAVPPEDVRTTAVIASIVLVHNATLVSANLRDFEKVPGLQVEDWLTE